MDSITLVNVALLLGALLIVVGIASSLVASRFGAPLLLVFLVIGMLVGEDGPGGVVFNNYQATYLVGSLALAIILFDGGLRTNVTALRSVILPAGILATLGVLLTAGLTGLVASYLLDFPLLEGLLIGAIVASTDAAAVFFLMRAGGLQLRRRVGTTLEVESGTNDPVAVFLTIALVELLLAGSSSPGWQVLGTLMSQGIIGAAAGVSGGLAVAWVLNRITMPGGLHPLFVVASAVLIFGVTAVLNGSGFLAVYLAGLILGNRPVRAFPSILSFHDAATWLVQLVMFILLGLLVTPSILLKYAVPALVLAVFLIFVGRPLAVWLCLWPFGFTAREKLFVSWVGLRGAVSIFLAAVPMLSGVPNAEVYFNVAFFIVLVSLLVQGWTLTWTAKRLHVALDQPAPEARRVEIDLPGQLELEMVGYPILADSPVRTRKSLPSWVRPVFIVRNNEILAPDQAGRFQAGDYGYFLANPNRVQRLDRLFAPREVDDPKTAGVFLFKGDVRLADVALTYGLPVPDDLKALTIAEAFAERFENRLAMGDVLHLGAAALIAIETDGDLLLTAALEFEDEDDLAAEALPAMGSDGRIRGSGLLRAVDLGSRAP
jgi:cell volume regulation protein A